MKSLLVFLGALLCLSQAYVSPINYYIFGDLTTTAINPQATTTQKGLYTMVYDGSSKSLAFQILTNLQGVGAVELHGPASCKVPTGGIYQPNQVQCVVNTAGLLETFGHGRAVTTSTTDKTFQMFKGSMTLSASEEAMLFAEELYIVVNSATLDQNNNPIETPFLRGNIGVYTLFYSTTNYPTYFNDNRYVFFTLSFAANDGSFPAAKTGSQSLGTGYLWFYLQNGVPQSNSLGVRIYSTIGTPGTYFLQCSGSSVVLNNNQNNPNPLDTQITLTTAQVPIFLELMASKECYIFITSSAYPDGDIYSWITVPSNMDAFLMGSGETAPVPSPYYGRASFYFDYGAKELSYLVYHNITSGLTGAFVEFDNGTMICNVTSLNTPGNCYVNDSVVPFFSQGKVYMNLYTVANPGGELRGQVVFNGKTSASLGASTGLPSSTAIGLGVGLGIGIPLVIALGVGIFCLVKRSGGGSSKGI